MRIVLGSSSRTRARNSTPRHARHAVIGEHERDGLRADAARAPCSPLVAVQDREVAAEGELEDAEVLGLVVDVEDRELAVVEQPLGLGRILAPRRRQTDA